MTMYAALAFPVGFAALMVWAFVADIRNAKHMRHCQIAGCQRCERIDRRSMNVPW